MHIISRHTRLTNLTVSFDRSHCFHTLLTDAIDSISGWQILLLPKVFDRSYNFHILRKDTLSSKCCWLILFLPSAADRSYRFQIMLTDPECFQILMIGPFAAICLMGVGEQLNNSNHISSSNILNSRLAPGCPGVSCPLPLVSPLVAWPPSFRPKTPDPISPWTKYPKFKINHHFPLKFRPFTWSWIADGPRT